MAPRAVFLALLLTAFWLGRDVCALEPLSHKHLGYKELDVKPAFLNVQCLKTQPRCSPRNPFGRHFGPGFLACRDTLLVSSYFNVEGDNFTEPDQVLMAPCIRLLRVDDLEFERITDRSIDPSTDAWVKDGLIGFPSIASRVPDGIFPFEAVVIPAGFLISSKPGGITVSSVAPGDDTEVVITASTTDDPEYYLEIVWVDMDGDGNQDLLTVRSGLGLGMWDFPPFFGPKRTPLSGDLVWFRNPGMENATNGNWEENVIFESMPTAGGPDAFVDAADLDGDGVVEIVVAQFYEALDFNGTMVGNGNITLFGVPSGLKSWEGVGPGGTHDPRVAVINGDQGAPLAVLFFDLNGDGKMDVLASNHQPDGISFTSDVPARVFALTQPADGNIYQAWDVKILLDDVLPNPSPPGALYPGRQAPGHAVPLPVLLGKPWILVSGDEASKVWVLRPNSQQSEDWTYDATVVFDINNMPDLYPNGTQVPNDEGEFISTIGQSAVNYMGPLAAVVYVPVFEARHIHAIFVDLTSFELD